MKSEAFKEASNQMVFLKDFKRTIHLINQEFDSYVKGNIGRPIEFHLTKLEKINRKKLFLLYRRKNILEALECMPQEYREILLRALGYNQPREYIAKLYSKSYDMINGIITTYSRKFIENLELVREGKPIRKRWTHKNKRRTLCS